MPYVLRKLKKKQKKHKVLDVKKKVLQINKNEKKFRFHFYCDNNMCALRIINKAKTFKF